MSNKYLIVDTNVLLHYQPINQINWSKISGCENPIIYVPLIVIEELDKHKDQHRLAKMRERARKTLALIDKVIGDKFSGDLREGVQLIVESVPPKVDWEELKLEKNKPDHQVIASAFAKNSDSNQVAVVHRDYTIKLTLRRLKLQSLELPAELLLEDAVDESDREIKTLRLENERLKSRLPKLCLESGKNSNRGLIVVGPKLHPYSPTELEDILQRLRGKYPLMEMENTQNEYLSRPGAIPSSTASLTLSRGITSMSTPKNIADMLNKSDLLNKSVITNEQRKHYNDELYAFFEEYRNWLIQTRGIEIQRSLFRPLDLWIFNSGSCPAQDVDVKVRFPNFVSVSIDENSLYLPPEPKPPERPKPKNIFESYLTPDFRTDLSSLHFRSLSDLNRLTNFQPEASIYEDDRGTCVAMHWDNLKHGYRYQISPIPHVQFESYEFVKSFQLEYWISAANLSSAREGTFNVEVRID
ncbi:MAG: PIN domain-containing protein [Gemmatimonadetes bacterium]|nr:PIN domain-containing protein [Gemmatimonadota bacterium]